jgi:CheY-like chemotaxis protein
MKLTSEQLKVIHESSKDEAAYHKILQVLKAETERAANDSKLIMVVDDEETVSAFVRLVLEQHGYQTVTTTSGISCLELLKNHTPDLILMDISMPDMDGGELFSRVRQTENGGKIPVIFITGLISQEEESEFNKVREDRKHYLGKPFTPNKLLIVVKNMLTHPD